MKRAIVLGAAGFIGLRLVRQLCVQGYQVDSITHSHAGEEKLLNLDPLCSVHVYSEGHLEEIAKSLSSGGDIVFFFLSWEGVSGRLSNDILVQTNNIHRTLEAIRLAHSMGCRRFIGLGSIHEVECIKQMESKGESASITNYKGAKLAAHYLASVEARKHGIDFIWPRLTNAYGVGENSSRLVCTLIRKLLQGEKLPLTYCNQLYNFIYVDDAVDALIRIAEEGSVAEHYVIGTKDIRPLKDYLVELTGIVAPGIMLEFGELGDTGVYLERESLVSEALFDDLHFEPKVSFDEGIRLTAEYLTSELPKRPS